MCSRCVFKNNVPFPHRAKCCRADLGMRVYVRSVLFVVMRHPQYSGKSERGHIGVKYGILFINGESL
ncbi:hypothetical protein NDU88_001780 [Pleurodeles waltl]|uniref:Uncharacterized protein n=1 Tax=Pleurodeles waltl TaxID=8319 RepID=A0AAV7TIR5_PLEWA|nr:hypothetical protein NDU88_001780 [Pleurodeles waltl]